MSFSINRFKSALVGDGARSTLFEVQITNPILGVADFKVPLLCKTAALPSSTVGSISVPYFGRQVKYGGDRTFEDWTVTIINDEDFAIRNAMEAWSNAINSHSSNTRALSRDYKSDAIITQFAKDMSPLRVYNFQGIHPTNISDIATSWDSVDTIEEFTVTFQYDLWTIAGGTTGNSVT